MSQFTEVPPPPWRERDVQEVVPNRSREMVEIDRRLVRIEAALLALDAEFSKWGGYPGTTYNTLKCESS